jgi:ABC-type transport system involved in cytochrome bd biosynthesis fused ATPase/permease subunit
MRAFIFSVWVHVKKTSNATLEALESLAAKQYTTAEAGGKVVVSATVQGKSFTYEIPEGQSASDFLQLTYDSWRMVKIGGTSGAQMTDAELDAYLCDTSGEVTDRTVAVFAQRTY